MNLALWAGLNGVAVGWNLVVLLAGATYPALTGFCVAFNLCIMIICIRDAAKQARAS